MQEKEQFDASINLAKFWASRRDARRQNQIRLTLAVWAALAAATLYLNLDLPKHY